MGSWKAYLENSTLNLLPTDFVRSSEGKVIEASVDVPVPATVAQALSQLGNRLATSDYVISLALYLVLVHRLTGDEDVVVGSALPEGANHHNVARYSRFSKTTTLKEVVEAVKTSQELAFSHPMLHADLRRSLNGDADMFRTLFFLGTPKEYDSVPFKDLAVILDLKTGTLTGVYNSLLFKRQRIQFLLEEVTALVIGAAKDEALSAISLITPSQLENKVIPDPTVDLDWNNFRGAIQDIFASNAAKFPDRECIVETASSLDSASKTRSFTYRQIDEASNVVAHHLKGNGIVVDDVVMIYAFRGVDLVIAVMGVLKAGATFSVIDPAYPAARQNIYLSVAKPRGLIVLDKAGKLAPAVTEYIEAKLNLKVRLTGLALPADGDVAANEDLTSAKELRQQQTGVRVGPDNHPTLSFTSGSEGIPKGVRGRHFSLAYYFPWMSQTFGLSDNDKFTMLSGIAHDPIQRDIFTPLFLGARLYVPTADDIGTPGRLAEWMAENGCSVTHLTPAMGQLLSAQATAQIPALRNAFFVGDILTKRDCLKLQALAHNVAIINMYGTTETQRAVSYFRVPSVTENPQFLNTEKDTIPAGKGMLNVQMLVVNRDSPEQICGVGEVGEIYVRAGGLSDGYLELPDMTAQKFLTSWFVPEGIWKSSVELYDGWLGPRDRLYRTGDLGRYLPDGNTEVSGRADDQVKIRGFRIELGEINAHLSKHPQVRENVTLVRRDKDEEAVLVAYIVPETQETDDMVSAHESLDEDEDVTPAVKGLVRYQRLIKSIRSYLKTRLPSYAIPSLIVPLPKLPLNPNGKIDKPRLPFPDTAQMELANKHLQSRKSGADSEGSEWTPSEVRVRDLWISVLPNRPPTVEVTDSFFDLGGHSILATKMIFEARSKLGVPDLPLGAVFSSPTIKAFAKTVDELKGGTEVLTSELAAEEKSESAVAYGDDANELAKALPQYVTPKEPVSNGYTVFLTGATGFLGTYILRDLLERPATKKVIVQVRARDVSHGLERVKTTGKAYGIWKDEYAARIEIITGPLETKRFGMSESEWQRLTDSIDVIIHNGALVHWVYPYSVLRGPNVIGTINVMELCASGKPKYISFVSSTSVLDNAHYVDLSDTLVERGLPGIPESDSLEGSRSDLNTGYGQSKWNGEYLLRQAGQKHGLRGAIIRPGYIVGDSQTGVSNTDDFLLRMLKGTEELGLYPGIINSVNMVPVDHVARVTVAATLNAANLSEVSVVHVTSHPRITFDAFLSSLNQFGYEVKETEYVYWRAALEKFVVEKGDSALFPLLHFVLDNLPQDTKAPELDDANAQQVLKADQARTGSDFSAGAGVDMQTLGIYISFLVAVGFLEPPKKAGLLPKTKASREILNNFSKAGGRTR